MNKLKVVFFSFFVVLMWNFSYSQPKDNSPYSRFGLGDIAENNFIFVRGTGLGNSTYSYNQINITNPASYGYIATTIFDLGFYAKNSFYNTGNNSESVFSGNMDYISLAFPLLNPINDLLEKKQRDYDIGFNVTLKPFSNVGFNIKSTSEEENIGTIERYYQGSGGTYKFMGGLGGRYKDLALGFNAGYFFGKISYDREIYFADIDYPYNDIFNDGKSIKGFLYDAGLLYSLTLNKKAVKGNKEKAKKITFGIRGNGSTSFSTKDKIYNKGVTTDFTGQIADTILYVDTLKGSGTLPSSFGFGIQYNNKNKWIIGLDYSANLWSQYANELTNDNLKDSYEMALGMQYTPNENSFTNFFDRVKYRMSIYYKTDPRYEGDNQMDEKGVHLGFGFPIIYQRKSSNINADISFGKRGGNLSISENFVKIGLSVTINDSEWFIKRKYY